MLSQHAYIYDGSNSTQRHMLYADSTSFKMYAGTISDFASRNNDVHIFSNLYNQTYSDAYIDGTLKASSFDVGTQPMGGITIGSRYADFSGEVSISEIIVYPSDQSAARTNIEYNINNAYSIY